MSFNLSNYTIPLNPEYFNIQEDKVAWKFKHEFLLNAVNQRGSSYTGQNFVDSTSTLIRECKPFILVEWIEYYFSNAVERKIGGEPVTMEKLKVLGKKLQGRLLENFERMGETTPQIPEGVYFAYIYNLTLLRTWDGYFGEERVHEWLVQELSNLKIKLHESQEMDTVYGVDKYIKIGKNRIGFQVKPGDSGLAPQQYIVDETHQRQHTRFTQEFHGRVFWIYYNNKGVMGDEKLVDEIRSEIVKLRSL